MSRPSDDPRHACGFVVQLCCVAEPVPSGRVPCVPEEAPVSNLWHRIRSLCDWRYNLAGQVDAEIRRRLGHG